MHNFEIRFETRISLHQYNFPLCLHMHEIHADLFYAKITKSVLSEKIWGIFQKMCKIVFFILISFLQIHKKPFRHKT